MDNTLVNKCYVVQTENRLEVYIVGRDEKKMLDRVSKLLGEPMDANSKKAASLIIDGSWDKVYSAAHPLSCVLFRGTTRVGHGVPTYLGLIA